MWNLIPGKKEQGPGSMMTADPWDREFSRLRSDFDSLVQRMWSNFPANGEEGMGNGRFGLDVEETETDYLAHVVAPGFDPSDFDVSVCGNHLVVKAEHKQEKNENGGSSYHYGRLHEMIPLPHSAEADKVEATYRNGILDLKIPKGAESQGKRIEVKAK